MRVTERLRGLKKWVEKELCEGRELKAPAKNMNIAEIVRQEPRCYLAWAPSRMDSSGHLRQDPDNVVPSIIIMPNQSYAKYMEEQRFDRYNNIHRPKMLGQHLGVSILFSVYEPGTRLEGFVDSVGESGKGMDMSLIMEGTEEGLMTLLNWMDECMEKMLGSKVIPETDMFVDEASMTYSLYTDQNYVVDKRPIYYGFINVDFACYVEERFNPDIYNLLK